ncbi:MAG: hypothetical protein OIN66_04815, partial [Candidatus Methanoperedens sp.]|nr:hypothetical protein [Candidatus Methanoperedens sp.]
LLPDLKGYKMLERYEAKVSRTVLRRGRTSNRSSLFGKEICCYALRSGVKDFSSSSMNTVHG